MKNYYKMKSSDICMKLRIHNIILHTKVLGPGVRTAIWFQGCNRNCNGCMSQATKDTLGGKLVDVEKICDLFINLKDIEGITISGGEAFLQIDALYEILKTVKDKSKLGVIIYTGFYIKELKAMNNPKIDEILTGLADIIIDGPYVEKLNDGKGLKGSSNQTVNFITERYLEHKSIYYADQRDTELYVNEKDLFFVGIPNKKTLESWNEISDIVGE